MWNKEDLFLYSIILIILLVCLRIYYESDYYNLTCVISDVDGEKYCVRERTKLHLAADLLAEVTQTCKTLVKELKKKYPNNENVQRLCKNFNPTKICETLPTSEHTAYSENKGEKIAFCLNTTKDGNKLIDINTLTFVALHELSHVMTESQGHKRVFWENFKFLLQEAVELKLYAPIDYKKNPQPYCGMDINDNPFYDM